MNLRIVLQAFAVLAVLFALTAAIIGDSTNFMLPVVIITAPGVILF